MTGNQLIENAFNASFLIAVMRLIFRRLPRSFQKTFHQGFVVIFQLKVGGSRANFSRVT